MSNDNWLNPPSESNRSMPPDPLEGLEQAITWQGEQWPKNHPPDGVPERWRPTPIDTGGSMASVSEVVGVIQHAKGGVETEVAASVRGTIASVEDVETLLHSLMGDHNPPSLIQALAGLAQIKENANQSLGIAQGVMNSLDTYAQVVQTS
jgi:hypothetical protein